MKVRAAIAAAVLAVTLTIPANALAYRTWFEFARQSNIASTLTMVWQYGTGYNGTQTWRAGSGVSTDACWIGHGWLPTGYYDLWGHWDNFSGKIAGRVFYLQNKPCWNGTWRTELFVHSEETAGQGQYCPTAGDDPYCWEGVYDYQSNGDQQLALRPGRLSQRRSLSPGKGETAARGRRFASPLESGLLRPPSRWAPRAGR